MTDPNFFYVLWSKVKAVVLSRKFWAAIGATIVLFTQQATLSPEQYATGIIAIWAAYIGATAIEDGLRAR